MFELWMISLCEQLWYNSIFGCVNTVVWYEALLCTNMMKTWWFVDPTLWWYKMMMHPHLMHILFQDMNNVENMTSWWKQHHIEQTLMNRKYCSIGELKSEQRSLTISMMNLQQKTWWWDDRWHGSSSVDEQVEWWLHIRLMTFKDWNQDCKRNLALEDWTPQTLLSWS